MEHKNAIQRILWRCAYIIHFCPFLAVIYSDSGHFGKNFAKISKNPQKIPGSQGYGLRGIVAIVAIVAGIVAIVADYSSALIVAESLR